MNHIQITAQAVAEAIAIERKRSADEIEKLRAALDMVTEDLRYQEAMAEEIGKDREQLQKSLADLTDQACAMEAEIERLRGSANDHRHR